MPWLPSIENVFLTTIMPEQLKDTTVDNLMDVNGRSWDMKVIEDVLNNRDVELIKRVPIPMQETTDS